MRQRKPVFAEILCISVIGNFSVQHGWIKDCKTTVNHKTRQPDGYLPFPLMRHFYFYLSSLQEFNNKTIRLSGLSASPDRKNPRL